MTAKNISEFSPTAADYRAIEKYRQDEQNIEKGKRLFGAFIAKSFKPGLKREFFYFSTEVLLYQ
jgi:hypothetical protein